MRKQYIRWIVPMIALLLIATALVLTDVATHAAGAHTKQPTSPHYAVPAGYWCC